MVWQRVQTWLGMRPPVLALTLVNQEVRYVVRQGTRVLAQGYCAAPEAFKEGRLVAPERLARALLPLLPSRKGGVGQVAVLLPTQCLQLHEVSLPVGLDAEELSYQMGRYITHTLALTQEEVFYDWAIQETGAEKRVMTVLLAVARQSEVAPFHQMFVDSDWRLKWVCPEPQVWSLAYQSRAMVDRPVAVCRIEFDGVAFWLIESDGRVRSFYHVVTEQEFSRVGFVYQSGSASSPDAWVRFPTRFVGDMLEQYLSTWLGQQAWRDLNVVYVTGKGVNWSEAIGSLQARFGLPFRLAEEALTAGQMASPSVQPLSGLAALWLLAGQVDL